MSYNLGVRALAYNVVYHAIIKHIEIDFHYVHEKVFKGLLEIRYVPPCEHTTNIFTKPLGTTRFLFLISKINVTQTSKA